MGSRASPRQLHGRWTWRDAPATSKCQEPAGDHVTEPLPAAQTCSSQHSLSLASRAWKAEWWVSLRKMVLPRRTEHSLSSDAASSGGLKTCGLWHHRKPPCTTLQPRLRSHSPAGPSTSTPALARLWDRGALSLGAASARPRSPQTTIHLDHGNCSEIINV